MSLLAEVHKIMKKMEMPKLQDRNYVAKNAQRAGAGIHVDKVGSKAPRNRQKKEWKKEVYESN